MSECPAPEFQDPNRERATAFEEWWQREPPAAFVNYRTACHRAFIAGYNTEEAHVEALEKDRDVWKAAALELGEALDAAALQTRIEVLETERRTLIELLTTGRQILSGPNIKMQVDLVGDVVFHSWSEKVDAALASGPPKQKKPATPRPPSPEPQILNRGWPK